MDTTKFRTLKGLLDAAATIAYTDEKVVRLKGGQLLDDIVNKIRAKLECIKQEVTDCQSINNLQMFGYSTVSDGGGGGGDGDGQFRTTSSCSPC